VALYPECQGYESRARVTLAEIPLCSHGFMCQELMPDPYYLKIGEQHVVTVTGKAFYDIAHAPADHPNRRHWPKDYAAWEIHPVMKVEAIRN
jgi:hypothetical protein